MTLYKHNNENVENISYTHDNKQFEEAIGNL